MAMMMMMTKWLLASTVALVWVASTVSAFVPSTRATCPASTTSLPMYADRLGEDWMLESGAQGSDYNRQPYPRRYYNNYNNYRGYGNGYGRDYYPRRGGRYGGGYGGRYNDRYGYHDYENSMDKQHDVWRRQQRHEDFIDNPYGTSRHYGGNYYRQSRGYDQYDRDRLYDDVTMRPSYRGYHTRNRQWEMDQQTYARDAFIENPYGNRYGRNGYYYSGGIRGRGAF